MSLEVWYLHNAWCYQMLWTNEGYNDTRPAPISTRREDSEPTSRNRWKQETFCGASMVRPTGLRHGEIPKLSRSRSTDVLGVLAAENSSSKCLSGLFRVPNWVTRFAEELFKRTTTTSVLMAAKNPHELQGKSCQTRDSSASIARQPEDKMHVLYDVVPQNT